MLIPYCCPSIEFNNSSMFRQAVNSTPHQSWCSSVDTKEVSPRRSVMHSIHSLIMIIIKISNHAIHSACNVTYNPSNHAIPLADPINGLNVLMQSNIIDLSTNYMQSEHLIHLNFLRSFYSAASWFWCRTLLPKSYLLVYGSRNSYFITIWYNP